MASANDLSKGNIIVFEKKMFRIISNDFHKPGKGQPVNRLKMKSISCNANREITVAPDHKLTLADIEDCKCQYMYSDDKFSYFIDSKTHETELVANAIILENRKWLIPDIICELSKYKDNVICVKLPTFVNILVSDADKAVKGNTAGSTAFKTAVLETGYKLLVPIFIKKGELIKVDTRTGEYKSRAI